MATALAEEIAVLKNEIALYECHSEAAKVNGDIEMQRLLLATITARSNNLLYLEKRLEKQGNRNQSAMSRGIKGIQFSSKLLGAGGGGKFGSWWSRRWWGIPGGNHFGLVDIAHGIILVWPLWWKTHGSPFDLSLSTGTVQLVWTRL
jgi:hypothetical protein